MAGVSHNHANYQARLEYIQQILGHHLCLSTEDLEQTKITPIQYDPDCPFRYNNFVYRLSLPAGSCRGTAGSTSDSDCSGYKLIKQQPGCMPIPRGTSELILRLSNPDAEGMHQETRVQNEVAILSLASAALRHIEPRVVPRVFGWGRASDESLGWILQELMPGVSLSPECREAASLGQENGILAQMARILKALQAYPLPETIEGWGGVTFDDSGAAVSASMSYVGAGPWSSLEDCYRDRLRLALAQADKNPYLQGWHANGVRGRVDEFMRHGLAAQFSNLTSKKDRTITHADFTFDNLLWDPTSGRITALLDYDFSSIQHPSYEFFRSFTSNGGQLTGWLGDTTPEEREAVALREAKLSGRFPSPLPAPFASAKGPSVDWKLARAWEDELQKLDVKRPSSMQGIDKLADVDGLLSSLLPWRLVNDDFLAMNQDEEQRLALRRLGEREVVSLLDHLGF